MHKLLLRQLRRARVELDAVPPPLARLLELVSDAYDAADAERALMERSLELTSSELIARNRALRSELATRQQTQDALARGQRELREIIEGLPSAVFVRRGSQVVFANATTVRALGYDDASQIVGRSFVDFIHPEDRPKAVEAIAHFEAHGTAAEARFEYRVLRRDGVTSVFERTTVKEIAFEGENAVLLVFNDVTDRRKMLTRLQLADRMASDRDAGRRGGARDQQSARLHRVQSLVHGRGARGASRARASTGRNSARPWRMRAPVRSASGRSWAP